MKNILNRNGHTAKSHSIKWKIFAYFLGFCGALLLALWLFQAVLLEAFYTRIKFSEVEKAAAQIAGLAAEGNLDAIGENINYRGDLSVEVIDENGNVFSVSPAFPEAGGGQLHKDETDRLWENARANGGSYTQRYTNEPPPMDEGNGPEMHLGRRDKPENIISAKIVENPDGGEQLVVVRAMLTPVRATVEAMGIQLFYVSIIMVALSVGLALLLARRVAKPIISLNDAAAHLAEGQYDPPFEKGGYREVDELSSTLSHTAGELSKTENLRRELIANVSHDLRTPLTLITGYAEMVRDIPGEDTPENMQVIVDEANRLSSLVADLLDFSRLQSGTGELYPEEIDLSKEIAEILIRFSKFSEPEGFKLVFENDGPAPVFTDAARMQQVLYNFLTNAMAHSGADKTITVCETKTAGRVKVEVADTGSGVPADQLPYIWDRYYKVDEPHKRQTAGNGLGLSIVKTILEQMPDVEYGVESTPGTGSTFWFSMPVFKG